jgi:Zn-dependent protease
MIESSIIQKIAIWTLPVLFAITGHEVAHGWVASFFGDQTARLSGRLTLNPIKHIDHVGTVIVPLVLLIISNFIFGWAKPVPIDARNLRHPRSNMVIVALAGPTANFLMAVIWAIIAKLSMQLPLWFGIPLVGMGLAGIQINVLLGVLNCLPIPPLDGGRALYHLLPGKIAWYFYLLEPYGFFILLLLMFTHILSYILFPPIVFLTNGIASLFNLM